MPSHANPIAGLAALALCLAATACTLEDGNPWGSATISLEAGFDASASRLTDDGWWKTNNDYLLQLETFEVELTEASLFVQAGSQGSTAFDPANPPEGYSLCHNGHCHADNGELVDYEDIQLEGGAGALQILRPVEDNEVSILPGEPQKSVTLAPCEETNACDLPRGGLQRGRLIVSKVRMKITVRDAREGEAKRTDELTLEETVPLNLELARVLEGSVGPDEKLAHSFAFSFVWPSGGLDNIEWSDPNARAPSALQGAFQENIDNLSLSVQYTQP